MLFRQCNYNTIINNLGKQNGTPLQNPSQKAQVFSSSPPQRNDIFWFLL